MNQCIWWLFQWSIELVSFLRRFFLSSIEAAVEHIRRGSVNDILKGLPPAKVSIKVIVFELSCTNVTNDITGFLMSCSRWCYLGRGIRQQLKKKKKNVRLVFRKLIRRMLRRRDLQILSNNAQQSPKILRSIFHALIVTEVVILLACYGDWWSTQNHCSGEAFWGSYRKKAMWRR